MSSNYCLDQLLLTREAWSKCRAVLEGYNLLNDDKMLRNVLLGNIIMYGQFRSSSIVKHIPFMVAESHLMWTPSIVNYIYSTLQDKQQFWMSSSSFSNRIMSTRSGALEFKSLK